MRSMFLLLILPPLLLSSPVVSQGAVDAPTGQKTLAATMNVYVFPTKGQPSSRQSQDEATCYKWAVGNTGTDPFELSQQAEAQAGAAEAAKQEVQQAGKGAGAKGALAGGAVGALIGGIADDKAGHGAAYGGAAGLIVGRRARRRGQERATEQIDQVSQQAQQATATQIENFKKAFSVCLEAKNYMVKF